MLQPADPCAPCDEATILLRGLVKRLLVCAAILTLMASGADAARNPLVSCQKAIDDVGVSLLQKVVRLQQTCLQQRDAGKLSPFTGW